MITNGAFSLLSIFFVLVCRFMHYRRLPVCVCVLCSHLLALNVCLICSLCIAWFVYNIMPMSAIAEALPTYYTLTAGELSENCAKTVVHNTKPCRKKKKKSACNCDRSESARLFHIASICHLLLCVLRSLPIAIFSDSFRLPSLFDSV